MGSVEQPLPSTVPTKHKHSNKIKIKNLPATVTQDDAESLISGYGTVKAFELALAAKENCLDVTYETAEDALQAYEHLENFVYHGSSLKVEFMNSNAGRQNRGRPRSSSANGGGNIRVVSYPLRILVPSEFVGAIIGKKGQSIKNITTRCKARVDVHGKENSGLVEKVISIYGQPENCTKACKEILQVMEHEAAAGIRGDISLKMLTNDRYCGRLIGKEGRMIKKIREDTGTRIIVTNAQEMAGLYPDRVISIRGNVDNMVQAEAAISNKLAECIEQDMKMPGMQTTLLTGLPVMLNGSGSYYPGVSRSNGILNQSLCSSLYGSSLSQPQQPTGMPLSPTVETCQISIPNSAVGAIIGSGGANIKQMMRDSGAFITVEHKTDSELTPSSERLVTIKGTVDACWRASYFVFEKMKVEGFSGNDDVRLKTTIRIPKSTVGRIIGKGGKNVREIQRLTGGIIKLPQDQNQIIQAAEDVPVEVFGNFMAAQSAHSRIRAIVNLVLQQSLTASYYGQVGGIMPSMIPSMTHLDFHHP